MPLHGYPSKPVYQTYSKCYELLTGSANLSQRFDATWGLWLNRCIAGDLERSQQLTSELDAIAAESKSASDQLQADHAVFTVSYILGDLHKTYERTQAVRNSYSIDQFGDHCLRYGGHDPYVCSQCHGALSRWQMGYPQEAIGFCRDALDLAETLKHPPSTGVAVSLSAIFYQFTGDTASILALEEHADSAPTNMRLIMQAVAGWSKVILGSSDEGLQQCSDGAKAYRDLGAKARLSYVEYLLADAYLKLGRLDEALAIIEPACNQANDITTKAERFRLRAEILQRLGKMDQAEQIYFDAAKIARDQGALAWELRTTLSLSELRLSQDRRLEARDLLTPVYNRFSEGFATPDLQRARAVLSELAE